jgi:rSAM/selenodomain-associated transferase 1
MRTAVAVFCKTPGLSPVKTRLRAQTGKAFAEEFYQHCIAVMQEIILVLGDKKNITPYWAVAEKEAYHNPLWNSFDCIWTGEGGLGERIYHVFQELKENYDKVIILGSDSPQLTPDYILSAINRLRGDYLDGIIGPCEDGGFVLFGCNKLPTKEIWTGVEYSREDTLQQLTERLKSVDYKYFLLPGLGDIDNVSDIKKLMEDWNREKELLPQQLKLYRWLRENFLLKSIRYVMDDVVFYR